MPATGKETRRPFDQQTKRFSAGNSLNKPQKKQRLLCSLFCGATVARQVCRPRWRMARIVYRLDPSNRDQFDVVDSSGREGKQYKDSLLKSKVLCGEQCGNLNSYREPYMKSHMKSHMKSDTER